MLGSSPRMRGTHAGIIAGGLEGGIIPAYAGNTIQPWRRQSEAWDHPRVCGEHHSNLAKTADQQGSSPRMRGTLSALLGEGLFCGIIPAYAGNTILLRIRALMKRDHPRVCGEHLFGLVSLRYAVGIIPAYAGNTSPWNRTVRPARDHPRVCGEHIMHIPHRMVAGGSSPRMRGTH